MAGKKDLPKVTAVVPAYNEAARIGGVLEVLVRHPGLEEVIVVDDGSTDGTGNVVRRFPVRYLRCHPNQGKGHAMDLGVSHARGEVILFVDADVKGLTHAIIDEITEPVRHGEVEMFIGMRNRKIYYVHHVLAFVPLFGGERALTKDLWQTLPPFYKHRFRVEAGLNHHARVRGGEYRFKVFKGLSQVIKEKKYGWADGFRQRVGMTLDIVSAQLALSRTSVTFDGARRRLLRWLFGPSDAGIGMRAGEEELGKPR